MVKIIYVEKSVSNIEESTLVKAFVAVEESIGNIMEQIKSEVEQLMKLQP